MDVSEMSPFYARLRRRKIHPRQQKENLWLFVPKMLTCYQWSVDFFNFCWILSETSSFLFDTFKRPAFFVILIAKVYYVVSEVSKRESKYKMFKTRLNREDSFEQRGSLVISKLGFYSHNKQDLRQWWWEMAGRLRLFHVNQPKEMSFLRKGLNIFKKFHRVFKQRRISRCISFPHT